MQNVIPLFRPGRRWGCPYMGDVVPSDEPRAGNWYQVKKGDTVWAISKKAYQDQGLTTVKAGLFLMNDNPSNARIKKAQTGWESYGVLGLQLTPDYAENSTTGAHGSGKSYPLLWVPPLDGRTADNTGGKGEQGGKGDKGDKGDKGEKGDKGDPGQVSAALIAKLIADYMDDHPVPAPQIDPAMIAVLVAQYLKANPIPIPDISAAKIAAAVAEYIKNNPLPVVSATEIAAAVSDYMATHPIAQGAQGPQGPQGRPGEIGPPGPAPSDSKISKLISDYMEAHPAKGGEIDMSKFPWDQARDFVDARIRVAMRDLPSGGESVTTGNGLIWGALAAGVVGAALLLTYKSGKRTKVPNLVVGR